MDIKVVPKLNLPQTITWNYAKKPSLNWRKIIRLSALSLVTGVFLFVVSLGLYRIFNLENKIVVMEKVVKEEVPVVTMDLEKEAKSNPGWLTYQAPAPFDFNFSYPEDWHILVNTNYRNTVSSYAKATVVLSDQPIVLANKVQDYPIILEITNQTLTYKERLFDQRAYDKRKITIGDITATEFIGVNPDTNLKEKSVVFYKDKKVYVLVGLLNLHNNDYEVVFDELIASISF